MMKTQTEIPNSSESLRSFRACLAVAALLFLTLPPARAQQNPPPGQASSTAPTPGAWTPSLSLGVKEMYDGNVFMQRVTPLANESSFVTVVTPGVGAQWKPGPAFSLMVSYSPEIAFYHSEHSEDYAAHRGALNLGGKFKDTTWELPNAFTWIDGSDLGLTFTGPGGAPALGGVPMRDRRDALIYRGGFKLQHAIGDWFLRPVVSAYVHDFKTEHRATAGYQNYADRNDVNGGLDVGYKVTKDTFVVVGYRHGSQDQQAVLTNPLQYDNTYDRVLAGVEGKPAGWFKVSFLIGPDFRAYGKDVAAGFDRHRTKLFVDGTLTITPTKSDTFTLTAKRFEQPGYGGRSAYEDITYEIGWRHSFSDKLSAGVGVRALNWDFESPVVRNEWWYGVNVSVAYRFHKNFSAEAAYAYDQVESLVANTAGREARRHLASLGVKYAF